LICVKRPPGSGAKLKFDNADEAPIMSENPFAEFSALLQAQREQLLGEVREKIAASGEGLGFANQSKITDDDAMADSAAEMDVAMVIRESRELQDIEAALARIADGSYGVCSDCGGDIGRARLKAYPTAKRCLPCQEDNERLREHMHTPRL
jgi:RNA polymerase-binding protein DksA